MVVVPDDLAVGALVEVEITESLGTDLVARPIADPDPWVRRGVTVGMPGGGEVSGGEAQ